MLLWTTGSSLAVIIVLAQIHVVFIVVRGKIEFMKNSLK